MKLKETLKLAWENRHQIADGLWHKFIENTPEIDAEIARRKNTCEANTCGWYDPAGKPETSAIPGKPACSLCHCNIELKVHALQVPCALRGQQVKVFRDMVKEGKVLVKEEYKEKIDILSEEQVWSIIEQAREKGITLDIGPDALWEPILTEEQEKVIAQKKWEQQFKK